MTEKMRIEFVEACRWFAPSTMREYWEMLRKKSFCCWVTVKRGGEVIFDDRVKKKEWLRKTLPDDVMDMTPKRINVDATLRSRNKLCFVIE